jgi:dynactin complex subunit
MTIKTMEYIHKLLIEKEQHTSFEYSKARALEHHYEEAEEPDKELIKTQKEAADELAVIHVEALYALDDFESHEWH